MFGQESNNLKKHPIAKDIIYGDIAEKLLTRIYEECLDNYVFYLDACDVMMEYGVSRDELRKIFTIMDGIYENSGYYWVLFMEDALLALNMERIRMKKFDFSDEIVLERKP